MVGGFREKVTVEKFHDHGVLPVGCICQLRTPSGKSVSVSEDKSGPSWDVVSMSTTCSMNIVQSRALMRRETVDDIVATLPLRGYLTLSDPRRRNTGRQAM